ncbi:MAG: hypothetical protein MI922_00130 [Bacteroidales bacterium]|nr:hypothetical protein [Bacteroidales bacterium]
MKKYIALFILGFIVSHVYTNPTFTIGSNPYLTIFAYPHDLLEWPGSAVYVNYLSQKFPWQGNVDDIFDRPSESYINSYQNIEFATPNGYTGDPRSVYSWLYIDGVAKKKMLTLGGIQSTPYGKLMGELGMTSLRMNLESQGVARTDETNNYTLVPFSSEVKGRQYDYNMQLVYANKIKNLPIGAKLSIKYHTTIQPKGFLNYNREGSQHNTNHLTWGWATVSCNHIFGYNHINADAFFQNSYSVMKGYQVDLQASTEIKGNHKSGIRYRTMNYKGDDYNWRYDDSTSATGTYLRNENRMSQEKLDLIRVYSKARYLQKGNLDAGLLYFVQFSKHSDYSINRHEHNDRRAEDRTTEYILEVNPWFNYKFDKGYIDFGLLLEGSFTRLKNTSARWNSETGTEDQYVYDNSTPYYGWSTSWENFSKGYNTFFATGCETSTSISIYKRFSAMATITLLKKYSWKRKKYGSSSISPGSTNFEFDETHKRKLNKDETWITGGIGFTHGFGPIQSIVILQLPLAYLNEQRTLLHENKELLFDHKRKNMWQVQQPTALRVLVVYMLGKGGHP